MKIVKLLSTNLLLVALLCSCNSNGKSSETNDKIQASIRTNQEEDKFSGTYKLKNSEGEIMEQGIKISFIDGTYQFQAEGSDAIQGKLSEDGKILLFISEESSKTNEDGSIEANLGGEVKIYFDGDKLVYEMNIPDLGSEKMELLKQ